MSILAVNAGSSTLKFSVFDAAGSAELANGGVSWGQQAGGAELTINSGGQKTRHALAASEPSAIMGESLAAVAAWKLPAGHGAIDRVGHRVVHGGTLFRESVRIDEQVKRGIDQLAELAPLHNPPALAAIRAAEQAWAQAAHVAVFDTAFFSDLAPQAYIYPLPYAWYTEHGIRRFGFHGTSHAYCAGRAAELLGPRGEPPRLITCHLGNGCSASAVRDGKAVATTMGFTPMDGLMMGTRPGSIDPGILPFMRRRTGNTAEQFEQILNHESGLLGVSGVSGDYRDVLAAAGAGHERARLALAIYADRVRGTIGQLAVTLGGLEALVFTAGVGENSAPLREQVCRGLECLGVRLDARRNEACRADTDVAADSSTARILVLHTREELAIAREAARVAAG